MPLSRRTVAHKEQAMRARGAIVGATTVAATVLGGLAAPPANAVTDEMPINGSFIARSMGDWAQTRDSFHNEATVTSTWTINSTCTGPTECTGQVQSSQGWTAPLELYAGAWEIRRDIPNWEPCDDGTAYTGHQFIRFWGVDDDGMVLTRQSQAIQFAGTDRTDGESGACGINNKQVITMPFTMRKLA
jgi:hypothetical protein